MKIKFKPVGAQREFFHDDLTQILHLSAGFGFGKTTILLYKLLKLSRLNFPFHGGLVVPTFTDFKRDVMPAFETIFNKHRIRARFHGSDHYYQFPWSPGRLYVATAERKLRGPNWAYAGINELTLIPFIRFQEVIGRVRVKGSRAPQIVSSGTPEGIASEYYTAFVESPVSGSKILYGDTRENAENLDPGYVERVLASYPQALADAYIRGLWVNLAGNRFYFSYDPKANDARTLPDPTLPYLIAMDFNVDPFCASVWQLWGDRFVGFDEIVLEGGAGYKTENMITALRQRGYDHRNSVICPDPAGKNRNTSGRTDVEILQAAGYEVKVKASAPRFRERQINMNKLFEQKRIIVNPETQPKTKKDFMAVEIDPITLEKIKKNPKLTHLSDGVDYMVDIYAPFNDHRTQNTVSRIR